MPCSHRITISLVGLSAIPKMGYRYILAGFRKRSFRKIREWEKYRPTGTIQFRWKMTIGKGEPLTTLPERLRAARAVAGLSLDVLATQVGTNRQRLSRWERGLDPVPPLMEPGLIAAVAEATGFSEDFFRGGMDG